MGKERLEREIKEKEDAERKATEEARRQEELRPDKEKLLAFADLIQSCTCSNVENAIAANIVENAKFKLHKLANDIRKRAEEL